MPLLYFHQKSCISPQSTFEAVDLDQLKLPVNNQLLATEPGYGGIPAGLLRRMGKAIRMGVGSAMPLLKQSPVAGIIIGTANGGMEDCIKFLDQVITYEEGRLTPGNFVGSTPNAIAAQLGLLTANRNYNITHVQNGLSFENALLDAVMLVADNQDNSYLVGGIDEISPYNYNIDRLAGWFKEIQVAGNNMYEPERPGTLAGEGAAMFIVNGQKQGALAQLDAIHFFHSTDKKEVERQVIHFIEQTGIQPELFLSGENGDSRYVEFYKKVEALLPREVTVARFKHMCGEIPTAAAFACWLGCEILETRQLPRHMVKKTGNSNDCRHILVYNQFKGSQHSLMLLSKPV